MLNTQRLIRLTLTSLLLTAITSPSYAQSTANTAHDPTLQQNKHRLWIDRKHQQTRQWLQKTSHQIDDWFGEVDPNRPANANIRIILDTTWNEYNGVEFHPRVRGKIRLPTLEKKLSVVFGDERLDDEPQQQAVTTPYRANDNAKKLDRERERKENSSLALRWSEWNNRLPFDLDVDVGLRSYDNIFFRLKANKDWNLGHDFTLSSEQMYRYSTKHKNELHSFWQIHHQDQAESSTALQASVHYRDDFLDDLLWNSSLYRQHLWQNHKRLSYGVQSSGHFNQGDAKEWDLNSWGPFLTWRQPVGREWFFVQTEVNYLNNERLNRNHHIGTLLRLEALF